MKIKCIKNTEGICIGYEDVDFVRDWKPKPIIKQGSIHGLTFGKIYDGEFIGDFESRLSTIRIVIFNDEGKWDHYPAELFVPAGDL